MAICPYLCQHLFWSVLFRRPSECEMVSGIFDLHFIGDWKLSVADWFSFICLLVMFASSLEKELSSVLSILKSGYLFIAEKEKLFMYPVHSSLNTCSANIFSSSVCCRFFFIESFDTQKLSLLLIYLLCCCCCFCLWYYVQGFIVKPNVTKAQPCVTILFWKGKLWSALSSFC